jgi:hypothetical protein
VEGRPQLCIILEEESTEMDEKVWKGEPI